MSSHPLDQKVWGQPRALSVRERMCGFDPAGNRDRSEMLGHVPCPDSIELCLARHRGQAMAGRVSVTALRTSCSLETGPEMCWLF